MTDQSPQEHTTHVESWLDGFAVILSAACMVHCLLLPLALTVFPMMQGTMVDEEQFHLIMLFFILPSSLIALTIGCRKHKDTLTLALGATGLIILALTALFGHDWFGFLGERIATTVAGVILAGAHFRNFRCCRAADCHHEG